MGPRRVLACTWEPIITQYIHEIGRIDAEPHGADAIAPNESVHVPSAFSIGITGEFGRYGLRWAATPIGPTPGPGVGGRWRCEVEVVVGVVEAAWHSPPPPWGMQNVLCRFRWQTSAPK